MRKPLDELASTWKNFGVWYTLTSPPKSTEDKGTERVLVKVVNVLGHNWSYGKGRINEKMINDHLFPSGEDSLVLLCGPPPLIDEACIPHLKKIGYTRENMVEY